MATKVLLDTDIGTDSDDAIALALAMASPELDIVAVVATGKQARRRALLAKKILVVGGQQDVPVFVGADEPVGQGELYWFGHEGRGIVDDDEALGLEAQSGIEAYQELVQSIPNLEVIAIGSMSTIGRAINRYPGIADKFTKVTIMGGHVRTARYADTTMSPGIDYNLCIDPAASTSMLESRAAITLVPCEVTLQTWLTFRDTERLAAANAVGKILATSVRAWAPIQRAIFTGIGVGDKYDPDNADFLHDPLTVASAYADYLFTFEELWVEPLMVDNIFRTVERPAGTASAIKLRCATGVRSREFHELLMQRLAPDNSSIAGQQRHRDF